MSQSRREFMAKWGIQSGQELWDIITIITIITIVCAPARTVLLFGLVASG